MTVLLESGSRCTSMIVSARVVPPISAFVPLSSCRLADKPVRESEPSSRMLHGCVRHAPDGGGGPWGGPTPWKLSTPTWRQGYTGQASAPTPMPPGIASYADTATTIRVMLVGPWVAAPSPAYGRPAPQGRRG